MENQTFFQKLKTAFPNAVTDNHYTDLYVDYTKEIYDWIVDNTDYPRNVSTFRSAIDGKLTIEVLFAYSEYFK